VLLSALFRNPGELHAGLFQFGSGRRNARLKLAYALSIAALASRCALQFDGGLIGAFLRFMTCAVEFITALGELVLAGFLHGNLLDRLVDMQR